MIGIVILNYNHAEPTTECVRSLMTYPPTEAYRIYIVDNGSKTNALSILQEKFSGNENIVIRGLETNLGFARGNNAGLDLCEKDGITECILANSDILFESGSVDALIRDLREDCRTVIAGPHIELNGRTQHSSMLRRIRFADVLEIGRLIPQPMLNENIREGIHEVYSVSGCCFAVNIPLFRKMGAFDGNTFLYNEENILGIQAERAEYKVKIDLQAGVIHKHGESSGKENDFVRTEYLKSSLYYWKTYRGKGRLSLRLMMLIYGLKLQTKRKNGIHPGKVLREGKAYYAALRGKEK